MRLCVDCAAEKGPLPIEAFNIKNPATGNRMPWCRECGKLRSRRRYVSAAEAGIVSFARALLSTGSPFIGEACADCGRELQVGQEVEGCDITLRHVVCPSLGEGTPGDGRPPGDGAARTVAGPSSLRCRGFTPPLLGWRQDGVGVHWPAVDLANGHVEIWGASGSGKTQLVKALLAQLGRDNDTKFGIADFKNDYGPANDDFPGVVDAAFFDLWRDGVRYNPLALVDDDPRAIDGAVIEIRDAVATAAAGFTRMGHRQLDRLRSLLEAAYRTESAGGGWPTFGTLDDLLAADEDVRPGDRRYGGISAVLGDLSRNSIFRDGPPLGDAVERRVVFGLAGIPGNGLTTVLAAGFVLSSLMLRIQAQAPCPGAISYAVVVDEAHRVAALKAVETMVREGRSKGLSVILATQQPTDMPDIIGANAATRACFQLPDAASAAAAAKRLDPGDRGLAERIRSLGVGEAFVRMGGGAPQLLRMVQLHRDGPSPRSGAA
jgi:hypothetical protein